MLDLMFAAALSGMRAAEAVENRSASRSTSLGQPRHLSGGQSKEIGASWSSRTSALR